MAPQNQRYAQYQRNSVRTPDQPERGMMEECYHETEELVRRNPATTALTTFGVGFGLGLLLTSMLLPRRSHWYDPYASYMPDLSGLNRGYGHLTDSISRMLPDMSRHHRSWF